jgi:hypothetical protein
MRSSRFRRTVGFVDTSRAVALALLAPVVGACRPEVQSQRPPGEPAWLSNLIREFEQEPVANPPLSVSEFRYRGQRVYYVPPQCCDVSSTLYDSTGAVLCSPDGGITGHGDGTCPDFFQAREQERRVWQDPRSPARR